MPYKDPEQQRASRQRYEDKNREKLNAKKRATRAAARLAAGEDANPQVKRTESLQMAGARRRAQTLLKLKRADDLLAWGFSVEDALDDVGMTAAAMSAAARRYDFPELALLAGREYQRTHPRPADYEAKRSARRRKAA